MPLWEDHAQSEPHESSVHGISAITIVTPMAILWCHWRQLSIGRECPTTSTWSSPDKGLELRLFAIILAIVCSVSYVYLQRRVSVLSVLCSFCVKPLKPPERRGPKLLARVMYQFFFGRGGDSCHSGEGFRFSRCCGPSIRLNCAGRPMGPSSRSCVCFLTILWKRCWNFCVVSSWIAFSQSSKKLILSASLRFFNHLVLVYLDVAPILFASFFLSQANRLLSKQLSLHGLQ